MPTHKPKRTNARPPAPTPMAPAPEPPAAIFGATRPKGMRAATYDREEARTPECPESLTGRHTRRPGLGADFCPHCAHVFPPAAPTPLDAFANPSRPALARDCERAAIFASATHSMGSLAYRRTDLASVEGTDVPPRSPFTDTGR